MHPTLAIELTDDPIYLSAWQDRIADPDVGAHGWFLGVTRRTTGDAITSQLAYDAHRPMAIAELRKIATAAQEQYQLTHVVIVHRLGEVPIGEASVVVGCSSAHRKATFAALPWIMDRLKRDVPIWKQECYADGSTEWVHPIGDTESSERGDRCDGE